MSSPKRIEPGPGQESVWDYPRPPLLEHRISHLEVVWNSVTVAETRRGYRVLETSQPPAYYFPPEDVREDLLVASTTRTFCEWKGLASYVDLESGERRSADAAWIYRDPVPGFEPIRRFYAFYPQRVDACFVDGERVQVGEGAYYGGWITSHIVGPFKGGPGTAGW